MAQVQVYHKESRLRSLLKGLSWRVVAMMDTFLVAIIITWVVLGTPHLEESGWIMLIETPLKLAIYYVHERAWQLIWRDHQVSNREILMKTISWRIFATTMTFAIAYFIFNGKSGSTGASTSGQMATVALAISITELVSKTVLYFFHEKIWLRVKLGQVRKLYRRIKSKLT
ncbi:MAG: DUF2061 domain-containing protein [Bacteroidota bacterium]